MAQLAPTVKVAVSLSLQLELARMGDDERREFCQEMGVQPFDRGALLRGRRQDLRTGRRCPRRGPGGT